MEERREQILDPKQILMTQRTAAAVQQLTASVSSLMDIMQEDMQDAYLQVQHANAMSRELAGTPKENVIEDGKTKELIAVLNTIYESGLIARERSSKKEFFQRMADALGQPNLANYEIALSQIKQTYKYETIFDKLRDVAKEVRDKE